ncbi:PEP-CTERM sorting domain-containing protein [Coraliomargarita sp. W4R53]
MQIDSHKNALTTAFAIICLGINLPNLAQADTILYSDGLINGTPWANGEIDISTELLTPQNKPTLKFTTTEPYGNGGLNFYGAGGPLTVPANETILRATIYSEDASMNGFAVRMSTGDQNFDSTNGTWRLDGIPGNTKDFTTGQWHTLEFDLASHPDFKRGITQLQNDGVTFKVNETGATVYIGDLRLTESSPSAEVDIPEPSSFTAFFGIGALALILRRKSRK